MKYFKGGYVSLVAVTTITLSAFMISCSAPVSIGGSATSGRSIASTTIPFLISLPSSLTPLSTPTVQSSARTNTTPTLYGYQVLHDGIVGSQAIVALGGMMSVLWTEVINQNSLKTSSTTHSGMTLTVTSAFLKEFDSAVPAGIQGSPKPLANQVINVPDFVFQDSTDPRFSYEVTTNYAGASLQFFWKSQAYAFNYANASTTLKLATDGTTASSSIDFVANAVEYKIQFKSDSSSSSHGTSVLVTYTEPGITLAVSGYGDDKGGAVNETGGSQIVTEGFTPEGTIAFQKIGSTVTLGTALDVAYVGKLSGSNWGSAASLIR